MLLKSEFENPASSSGCCPLCGEPNACAVDVSKGQPVLECWCFQRTFPQELLDKLPLEFRGRVCVCAACLERFAAGMDSGMFEFGI